MPVVSVVIPCYNQGQYLPESIASVGGQTFRDFEILVVDDGSTQPETVRVINELSTPDVRVIRTENRGLASARNTGISHARGQYILPLDADDRIAATYLEKAAAVLDAQPQVGIVYCKAEFFGVEQGPWELPPYAFPDILVSPAIFASSFFRRSDWERVGGFSTDMRLGWEDYDFWLSLIERGAQVHCIPEVLFYYRQHSANMIAALTQADYVAMFETLFQRHRDLYIDHIDALFRAIVSHWQVPPHRHPRSLPGKLLDHAAKWGSRIHHAMAKVLG